MAEAEAEKYSIGPSGEKRLKGVQFSFPIITGTLAFSLGKKASEYATHRWTVYLRSPTGEDLTHILKKVTFELHSSFDNPNRGITHAPYELTESGWGEFDIVIKLHFHDDAMEPPLELYHHLQLGLDANGNPSKNPKPHLYEIYEDIVMWEPTEAFYQRVKNHIPQLAQPSQMAQYYGKFDPVTDYARVQNARKRLAPVTANLKASLATLLAEEEAAGGGNAVGMDMS
ncbi:hypothetical protein Ndes2526B_g02481 [Nannochloris sp. 'desiccata']|nr:hypothetical protein KSW81_007211 [Chlorella desiccata (nom. nud.)]KAH7621670.1 putative Transcription initiation factor TFIID subunit 14b [Chlorella desiccata (nom. nud.)]